MLGATELWTSLKKRAAPYRTALFQIGLISEIELQPVTLSSKSSNNTIVSEPSVVPITVGIVLS